jgi:hypothetical protein
MSGDNNDRLLVIRNNKYANTGEENVRTDWRSS